MMDNEDIPVTVWLTKPEVELLDRAIGKFITPVPEARPEFVLGAVRYGLLLLDDAGSLDTEVEGEIPEFVRKYRESMERRNGGETQPESV